MNTIEVTEITVIARTYVVIDAVDVADAINVVRVSRGEFRERSEVAGRVAADAGFLEPNPAATDEGLADARRRGLCGPPYEIRQSLLGRLRPQELAG